MLKWPGTKFPVGEHQQELHAYGPHQGTRRLLPSLVVCTSPSHHHCTMCPHSSRFSFLGRAVLHWSGPWGRGRQQETEKEGGDQTVQLLQQSEQWGKWRPGRSPRAASYPLVDCMHSTGCQLNSPEVKHVCKSAELGLYWIMSAVFLAAFGSHFLLICEVSLNLVSFNNLTI